MKKNVNIYFCHGAKAKAKALPVFIFYCTVSSKMLDALNDSSANSASALLPGSGITWPLIRPPAATRPAPPLGTRPRAGCATLDLARTVSTQRCHLPHRRPAAFPRNVGCDQHLSAGLPIWPSACSVAHGGASAAARSVVPPRCGRTTSPLPSPRKRQRWRARESESARWVFSGHEAPGRFRFGCALYCAANVS